MFCPSLFLVYGHTVRTLSAHSGVQSVSYTVITEWKGLSSPLSTIPDDCSRKKGQTAPLYNQLTVQVKCDWRLPSRTHLMSSIRSSEHPQAAGSQRARTFLRTFISSSCSAESHLNVCHAPCQSTERNNYLLKLIIAGTALALIPHRAARSRHEVQELFRFITLRPEFDGS